MHVSDAVSVAYGHQTTHGESGYLEWVWLTSCPIYLLMLSSLSWGNGRILELPEFLTCPHNHMTDT